MLALCLMLLVTYYTLNYASIMGGYLVDPLSKSMLMQTKQARPTSCQTPHFIFLNFAPVVMLTFYIAS